MTGNRECGSIKEIINLWNYALSKGASDLFSLDAPFVYIEVGKAAIERIRKNGIELIKETPLDTINAIYAYFTERGYFKEAHAKVITEGADKGLYEFHEKECDAFESNCWAFHSGECRSPACLCYNMFRYALFSKFGLDLKLEGNRVNKETEEEFAKVRLIEAQSEEVREINLMDELKKISIEGKLTAEKYKKIVNISVDAIVGDDENGIITLWNPAAEMMFGYSGSEAVGMHVSAIIPAEYREKHIESFRRFIDTEKPAILGKIVETEALKKDGTVFPVEMSLAGDKNSGKWSFMAIIRDATDKRKGEAALRQSLDETHRFNKLMIGRELKMEELRKEIRELKGKLAEKNAETQIK
jgi:PAS domain S-box-containing protein